MKVSVSKLPSDFSKTSAECFVAGYFSSSAKASEDKQSVDKKQVLSGVLQQIEDLTDGAFGRFLSKNQKFGKPFESASFYISPKKHKSIEKVSVVGLGKTDTLDTYKLKQISGYIGKNLTKKCKQVTVYFPAATEIGDRADAVICGFMSGTFDPGHFKNDREETRPSIETLEIFVDDNVDQVRKGVDLGMLISETIYKVREVVNLPGNIVTPEYLAKWAQGIATKNKLKATIFTEEQVNKMGMGIMASVARGSEEDLYFAVLEYLPAGRQAVGSTSNKTLAFIGKGITFDSGGLSIKPSESMEWMKMDMAGAAAVFGAIAVIAQLKLKINVIAACPLTENLPSGRATKPGDVVKGLSGKTVEVINTDAEGRLVLSDAITYVQNTYKPDYIVDVATLTGASVVALGTVASAALGKPQELVDLVMRVGERAGERFWQLPLYEEYREMLKSYIADIANVSATRGGGTETGAKFLEEFVDEKAKWVHLDIAPTAWEESEKPYQSKGATGIPVATMVHLAMELAGKN